MRGWASNVNNTGKCLITDLSDVHNSCNQYKICRSSQVWSILPALECWSNVIALLPLACQGEQLDKSRGSNSNAGKMDQTRSRYCNASIIPRMIHSRHIGLLDIMCYCEWLPTFRFNICFKKAIFKKVIAFIPHVSISPPSMCANLPNQRVSTQSISKTRHSKFSHAMLASVRWENCFCYKPDKPRFTKGKSLAIILFQFRLHGCLE